MNNQKLTSPLFWAAIIGAVKIVLDTVGIQIIDNTKVDALANGIAAAVAIAGVFVDHGVSVKPVTAQGVLDSMSKLVADLQPIATPPIMSTMTSSTGTATATITVSPAPAETPPIASETIAPEVTG